MGAAELLDLLNLDVDLRRKTKKAEARERQYIECHDVPAGRISKSNLQMGCASKITFPENSKVPLMFCNGSAGAPCVFRASFNLYVPVGENNPHREVVKTTPPEAYSEIFLWCGCDSFSQTNDAEDHTATSPARTDRHQDARRPPHPACMLGRTSTHESNPSIPCHACLVRRHEIRPHEWMSTPHQEPLRPAASKAQREALGLEGEDNATAPPCAELNPAQANKCCFPLTSSCSAFFSS